MEATKKKKAYLKPEMNRFEMKTEGIMLTTSRPHIEVGDTVEIDCFTIDNNNFTDGGAWSNVFSGEINASITTTLKNVDKHAKILFERGFDSGNCVKITKDDPSCPSSTKGIGIKVELLSKTSCDNSDINY